MKFSDVFLSISTLVFIFCVLLPLFPAPRLLVSQGINATANYFSVNLRRGNAKIPPKGKRLVIPVINVDTSIIEGTSEAALDSGVWRRSASSTPDKKGNTVLTAHRYLYTGFAPKSFYNLDKLRKGDDIKVYWEGYLYKYEVVSISVVDPSRVEVEGDFGDTRLTLYTCHPLWSSKQRLVVIAMPKSSQ